MKVSGSKPVMTLTLIGVNTALYLLQFLLSFLFPGMVERFFGLSAIGVLEGRWWTFVTYSFFHGGIVHLLLNLVGLWFGGRLVERVIGPGRLLLLYLFAGVAGGVLQLLLVDQTHLLLGASAAVCGIVIAFTTMFPEAELLVLVFFVIPLRLRAKFLGWALVLTSLLFLVTGWEPWIGHAAHLGGCLAGFLFARLSGYAPAGVAEGMVYRLLKNLLRRR
jgi:membrane associated rhomboid family serine protease